MNAFEFAASIKLKYPQYAGIDNDVLARMVVEKYPQYAEQVDLSVADRARERLTEQGLTPEAIKANPGGPMPSQYNPIYSGINEMLGADDGSGFDAKLRGEGQFLSGVSHALNPKEIGKGLLRTAGAVMGVRPVTDLLPDFAGTAKEAYRRGESGESASDMYGAAAGNAALMAATEGLSRVLKTGPGVRANAERSYAETVGHPTPLSESMARKMMDRKIIVNDPEALAARAQTASERITATRDGIPAPKTSELGDSAALARGVQRRTMAEEAKFQADLQAIAEAIPKQKTLGNVLTGAGHLGGVATVAHALHASIPAAITGAVATAKLLYEIPKTLAFKTATALAKRSFGAAMSAGDHALAADLGARIAAGAMTADDFGHRDAIQSLAQEADTAGPELRRQVVASKNGYYTDPDGKTIQIPKTVMAAMVDAKEVNETTSPVALWLGAMKKKGNIKGGGRLSFGERGPQLRQVGVGSEWPKPADAPDENQKLLTDTIPSALLPDRFGNAANVTWGAPLSKKIPDAEDAGGRYGVPFDPNAPQTPDPRDPRYAALSNTILIAPEENDAPAAWAHEVGHAIEDKDLTEFERQQWRSVVDGVEASIRREVAAAGISASTPNAAEKVAAITSKYPKAIVAYLPYEDEGVKYKESLAESWGQFMANPSAFQKAYPGIFALLERVSGVNYLGGKKNIKSGKPAWEMDGAWNSTVPQRKDASQAGGAYKLIPPDIH